MSGATGGAGAAAFVTDLRFHQIFFRRIDDDIQARAGRADASRSNAVLHRRHHAAGWLAVRFGAVKSGHAIEQIPTPRNSGVCADAGSEHGWARHRRQLAAHLGHSSLLCARTSAPLRM